MLLSILLNPTKYQASEAANTAKQVAVKLLEDGGANVEELRKEVEDYLGKQPKVSGDTSQQKSLGRTLGEVFEAGRGVRDGLKDSFISTEALLLGLCAKDTKFTINALLAQGVSLDDLKAAVQTMREKSGSGDGASRVTSRSAEGTYDALEKYGIDFTTQAEEGKLDPVIGRDDEIRRAIQVLSRRTKNNPVLIGDPGVGEFCVILFYNDNICILYCQIADDCHHDQYYRYSFYTYFFVSLQEKLPLQRVLLSVW